MPLSTSGTNLIVFRDNSQRVLSSDFAKHLVSATDRTARGNRNSLLDALVLAGQLESALADCDWTSAARAAAITDSFAANFVGADPSERNAIDCLSELIATLPESVRISEPEGFAYYALHPGDFADAAAAFPFSKSIAVIGIRSIGTTLSAMVVAALKKLGVSAARTTVRPIGHPYDRETHFTESQQKWIDGERLKGSSFLVVDEGPGLSGSSFLSVAESLLKARIAADRITLTGTREVDPKQLCTRDAARRWQQFAFYRVPSRILGRFADDIPLSAGLWRSLLLSSDADWPACWQQMESLRFLNSARTQIFKFEGFGRTGDRTRERAVAIQNAGFAPMVESAGDGMSAYKFIRGWPFKTSDLSPEMIDHIAQYCAFRAAEFKTDKCCEGQLSEMTCFNFEQEFGMPLHIPDDVLQTTSPVICDARMQPHKWVRDAKGTIFKVDGVRHGDDHFLPGPTDIAWDLAGTIVEWNMSRDESEYFVTNFCNASGHARPAQLPWFLLAYSLFKMSYCKMALGATLDAAEKLRLQHAHTYYREKTLASAKNFLTCEHLPA